MFDAQQSTKVAPPADQKDGYKLADAIISLLSEGSSLQESFFRLFQTAEAEVRRQIKNWQLTRVVEDEQISNTVTDFIEDLTGSPDENRFLAKILAMLLRQPTDIRQQLQYYSSRRIFTLLKKNASAGSQAYLAFNDRVKKQLIILADERQIKRLKSGYWATGCENTAHAADIDFLAPSVLAKLPISATNHQNQNISSQIKQSILQLLSAPEHAVYKFKTSAISTALFNLHEAPAKFFSLVQLSDEQADKSPQPHHHYEITAAADSIINQITLQIDEANRMQVLMTGLAYCFIACPDYFADTDFSAEHYEILTSNGGEIDRIHKFLNTEALSNLFNKQLDRSTVFNRIRSFKIILEASLLDFPVKAQQAGIKSLVHLMIHQYRHVTGSKK